MNGEQNVAIGENGPVQGQALDRDYDACREILEKEARLLAELAPVQEAVTRAVIMREWEGFDDSVNILAELSGRFETLEAERARIFADLPGAGGGEGRFYTLASRFPPEKRREIGDRYRELKRESFRIKMANANLLEYLTDARSAVGSFLEAALPSRSGAAYSRQGTKVPQDMRSMVLNHSF